MLYIYKSENHLNATKHGPCNNPRTIWYSCAHQRCQSRMHPQNSRESRKQCAFL